LAYNLILDFSAKPTTIPSLRPSDDEESKAGSTESSKEKEKRKNAVTKRDHLEAAADLMSDVQVSEEIYTCTLLRNRSFQLYAVPVHQVETYSSMDKREKTEL
jgi:hypothetical protein